MTTALTLITGAAQEIGVAQKGQTMDNADAQMFLGLLNELADAWLTEPNYAYTTGLVSASLSVNPMTIGPGMLFDCPRPVRIEGGSYVRVANLDYPLDEITQAEYNAVVLKNLPGAWPRVFYYDGGSPTGLIYFYPQGQGTIFLNVQHQLSQFADLATDYVLPPGYERAFRLTLAESAAPMFAKEPSPTTVRNARAARRTVKRANTSVPQLNRPINSVYSDSMVARDTGPFDGGSP